MTDFYYFAQKFSQNKSGLSALLFISPSEEITTWAGPPQKSSKFMKGYQRAEDEDRVSAIEQYFDSGTNISPTAIVVAFKPNTIEVIDLDSAAFAKVMPAGLPSGIGNNKLVLVKVSYDEQQLSGLNCYQLAEMVRKEIISTIPPDELVQEPNSGTEDEDYPQVEDEAESDEGEGTADKKLVLAKSHLGEFLAFLQDKQALDKAESEDPKKLRAMLKALLRPGTIVDGQHRAGGAARLEESIPFPVVALMDANWQEQVFQFVVINQKSKPIASEFLSSIISSSLTNTEINKLQKRLEQADVQIDNAVIMDLVQFHELSPFSGMVDFKVQGQNGVLSYAGVLGLAKRFQKLRTHAGKDEKVTFSKFFKSVFQDAMPDALNYKQRRDQWLETTWFDYFCAFWSVVKQKFAVDSHKAHLWEEGSNLLKIVALQELQNLFLYWLYNRMDPVEDIEAFQKLVARYFDNMSESFFMQSWKLTSLQSPTGREHLRIAIDHAVKSPSYKNDDPLFVGLSQ